MKKSSGFTLIELMVVIGIMILIASIVVTGSFGMSRASGYMAAENVVYNTLQAARQKACTDGKRVIVAFIKIDAGTSSGDTADYALVMAEAAGVVSEEFDSSRRTLRDRTSIMNKFLDGQGRGPQSEDAIWNLDTGDYVEGPFTNYLQTAGNVEKIKSADGDVGEYGYSTTVLELKKSGSNFRSSMWDNGHAYGFQIGEAQEMPTGFKLGVDSASANSADGRIVVFEPDGRSFFNKAKGVSFKDPSSRKNDGTIFIYEDIAPDNPIKITVKNGLIKVNREKK